MIDLSWGEESLPSLLVQMVTSAQRVIVVGADIVFRKNLFDPLITTLRQIFDCRPDVECLLGSQSIRTHLEDFYYRAEAAGFSLSLRAKVIVPEGRPGQQGTEPIIKNPLGTSEDKEKGPGIIDIVKVSIRYISSVQTLH